MLLRAKGVDIATIALWLGHESTQTTHIYEHADPALKEQAIARTAPLGTKPGRYRPSDTLLAFLEELSIRVQVHWRELCGCGDDAEGVA